MTEDKFQIVINWDPSSMWHAIFTAADKQDPDSKEIQSMLESIVDEHGRAGVDTLVHCVWAGFQTLMMSCQTSDSYDAPYEPPYDSGKHEVFVRHAEHGTFLAKIASGGTDFIDILLQQCRRNGMRFVAGLRMNDRHAGSGQCPLLYPHVQKMVDANPEWHLKEFPGGLNYKYDGVRDAVLSFVEEFLERHDVDGLEFDWMRWCHVFTTSEAVEHAPYLTDFTRKARHLLDAAADRRGRDRLVLGVRIPSNLDECRGLGYDVAAWVDEELVDYLCPSDFYYTDFNCQVDDFVTLTEGTACRVYPSIHPKSATHNRAWLLGPEHYRAAAKNFYAFGAHGVSPYNYQHHWDSPVLPNPKGDSGPIDMWPTAMRYLTELTNITSIDARERHYLYHPLWSEHAEGHSPTLAYENHRIILDHSTGDSCGSFRFRLAEMVADEAISATLMFKVTYMIEADALEIRLNDHVISPASIDKQWHLGQSPAKGRPLGQYFQFRIPLTAPPVVFGDNVLTVRLANRVGMPRRMLNVQEFEVKVDMK